ncbi:hypothetical protein BG011_004106 [Mortierella polycephala]|uniref:Uncharacterized protein n=1 Tax=Mortierella polycephala TaxID=41804 RepID=A0A9P6QD50_9FUNG|nr:hypothetical protein BG011_004106 [Mortierella polycephala]
MVTPLVDSPYAKLANTERVAAPKAGIETSGFKAHVVANCGEAFETIENLIPAGASVSNAHSISLEVIGFVTYLRPRYHLCITSAWNNGALSHADLSVSKVGSVVFGAANGIVLVGSNRIVKEIALATESARARRPTPNRIQIVLASDTLGF